MARLVAIALVAVAGLLPASAASAAVTRPQALALVTRILDRHEAACDLTWSALSARRAGSAWRVTVRVRTSQNPGIASWWVQRSSGKVTPAEPLAAEISAGCP